MPSYIQQNALYKAIEYTPKSFQRTRNIPIDTSFLLENLSELDIKIPLDIRYSGLIFFVLDAEINSGTNSGKKLDNNYEDATIGNGPVINKGNQNIKGLLYTFENDLTKPIPLHDVITRYFIYAISVEQNQYKELNIYLNNTYSKPGNKITVDNLDVTFICDYNGNWKYYSGIYKVEYEKYFYFIPDNLKQPNCKVLITSTNEEKIIKNDLTLSDEIIKENSPENCTENGRFYNINDYIYYCFGNTLIPISDKFMVKANNKLNIGNNIIRHNWNTRYLTVYGIINEHSENVNNEYVNICFPIQHKYINNNIISINSDIVIESIDLCLISKTHLTTE